MTAKLRTVSGIGDVAKADWDACLASTGASYNPFTSHAFLVSLEVSGSATQRAGWAPSHLVLESDGKLAGVAPAYVKTNSYGEYVFDHGWADAFERAGGRYYPKLQVSVPFTPVTGPRLAAATTDQRRTLANGLIEVCRKLRLSSVHVTFATEQEAEAFRTPEWLMREDIQFHWNNGGYDSFDDFLKSLSSGKRKNIRKERQAVAESGVTFQRLTGSNLKEKHWDHFFAFYMDTGSRKWGSPYLTRRFFSEIHARMPDDILLVLAVRAGRPIAGALNFIGGDALYGRNWGAVEHIEFLHFETCYYQAIDFAIERKLARIEAGAQGPHKLARGYLPVKTRSFHHLAHPGLARAVSDYLDSERRAVANEQVLLAQHSPFRQEDEL
ncbi:MAG: GNAT family N-acetyltransferase [Aestuariivirga sp.]